MSLPRYAETRFGKLTVIADAGMDATSHRRVVVRCDCGSADKVVPLHRLRSGWTKSCGCYRSEWRSRANKEQNPQGLGHATRFKARAETIEQGQRFGRLVVAAEIAADLRGRKSVLADCDCGTVGHRVARDALRSGKTFSCGCLARELAQRLVTHGKTNTQVYRCWTNVISRITYPKSASFQWYGGRGLDIDPRWRESFEAFYADMGDPPSSRHSIERRDNDRGYWPDNCCWATTQEQAQNRRPARRRS